MQNLRQRPLALTARTELFTHLAAMEKAGLPADKAYGLLKLPPAAQPRLDAARKLIVRGIDPASAGDRTGLFTPMEVSLLRAALAAGSPAPVYRRLADAYAYKLKLEKAVKSRMMLPAFIMALALFVQPLPRLITGSLSGAGYLKSCLQPLLVLGLLYFLYGQYRDWRQRSGPTAPGLAMDRLLTRLPVFGNMHVRRNARDFFENLGMLLEAGLPMFDALPKASGAVGNHVIRADYEEILPRMQQGDTLEQAASRLHYLGDTHVIGFIRTGESSGTLPDMLMRHSRGESEALDHFQQQLADWLPRLAYSAVAVWMAYGILGSTVFRPPAL
ncbi:type II secretion system F family protein [Undibacterium sp. TJN25]|uniref:type II secretion system F family protein n=1 Tax=Undibacterium sp. TJN25 TaxID=3413056 RepID=UPI003BF0C20C